MSSKNLHFLVTWQCAESWYIAPSQRRKSLKAAFSYAKRQINRKGRKKVTVTHVQSGRIWNVGQQQ